MLNVKHVTLVKATAHHVQLKVNLDSSTDCKTIAWKCVQMASLE